MKQVDGVRLHLSRRSSTGYSGVYPRSGRFRAQLRSDGKQTLTGTYDTAVEAAVAYAKHWIAVGGAEPKEEEMVGRLQAGVLAPERQQHRLPRCGVAWRALLSNAP